MNKLNKIFNLVLAVAVLIWSTPVPSHAYLDAGSGSMMTQLLLAGSAGFVVVARLAWNEIVSYVKALLDKFKSE